jgi:hypothetical protein
MAEGYIDVNRLADGVRADLFWFGLKIFAIVAGVLSLVVPVDAIDGGFWHSLHTLYRELPRLWQCISAGLIVAIFYSGYAALHHSIRHQLELMAIKQQCDRLIIKFDRSDLEG